MLTLWNLSKSMIVYDSELFDDIALAKANMNTRGVSERDSILKCSELVLQSRTDNTVNVHIGNFYPEYSYYYEGRLLGENFQVEVEDTLKYTTILVNIQKTDNDNTVTCNITRSFYPNRVTGIEAIYDKEKVLLVSSRYDISGRKHDKLLKGINIIRYEDGSVKKVIVR